MRLPYSVDIVPPGGHLFRSLQNPLNGINLVSMERRQNRLSEFFAQKIQKLYSD